MQLDSTRPLLAIVGRWNPEIFQPGWAAHYLFGYKENEQVDINMLHRADDPRQILAFIGPVGYQISRLRADLYLNRFTPQNFDKLIDVKNRLASTLPHTPVGDFGINFQFIEQEPSEDLLDHLKSSEKLERNYKILNADITHRIQFEPGVDLNLQRTYLDSSVHISFNYNHANKGWQKISAFDRGYIERLFKHSLGMLEALYDLTEYDQMAFDLEPPREQEQ